MVYSLREVKLDVDSILTHITAMKYAEEQEKTGRYFCFFLHTSLSDIVILNYLLRNGIAAKIG